MVPVARRALLYHFADNTPRLVLLGTNDGWDPGCGSLPYAENFDTSDWFPLNQVISSVTCFPGTTCSLANGYDIFSLRRAVGRYKASGRPGSIPANQTLRHLFSVEWPGNLLVMKRARHQGRAVHITAPEVSLINAVVQRYISPILRIIDIVRLTHVMQLADRANMSDRAFHMVWMLGDTSWPVDYVLSMYKL